MDPLSHAALGRTLGILARDDEWRRGAVRAATLGALCPDIDAVFMPFGWDRYLRVHEIGTHTVVGTLACAALVTLVLRPFYRRMPRLPMTAAAWIGASSHVLLDLVSSARIRVFWPFADAQVSLPAVAMADPWLSAVLVGGAVTTWLAKDRRRRAAFALCCGIAFVAFKGMLAWRAVSAYDAARPGHDGGSVVIVQAVWASLREWYIFERRDAELSAWRATAIPRGAEPMLAWSTGPDTASVVRSRHLSVVRNFLRAHPLAFSARTLRADGELVLWSDIRFCWNPAVPGAAQLEPIVRRGGESIACGLWFGVEFDGGGNPTRQIVRIGTFTQTRPPDD